MSVQELGGGRHRWQLEKTVPGHVPGNLLRRTCNHHSQSASRKATGSGGGLRKERGTTPKARGASQAEDENERRVHGGRLESARAGPHDHEERNCERSYETDNNSYPTDSSATPLGRLLSRRHQLGINRPQRLARLQGVLSTRHKRHTPLRNDQCALHVLLGPSTGDRS